MTNWRDATFPEAPGKILNMGRDGGKKESESSNYSNFPLPAKITDGASHTDTHCRLCSSGSWREPANRFINSALWEGNYTQFLFFQTLIFFLFFL